MTTIQKEPIDCVIDIAKELNTHLKEKNSKNKRNLNKDFIQFLLLRIKDYSENIICNCNILLDKMNELKKINNDNCSLFAKLIESTPSEKE